MRTRRPLWRVLTSRLVPLLVVALIAATCGGEAEPGTTTVPSEPGSTEAPATTAAPEPEETTTTAEAAGDPVRLVYASFAVEDSPHSQAFAWLAEEMDTRTNGRVTIEQFHAGSLCAFADIFDCIKDGRADFGLFLPVQQPSFLPYSSIGSVLFISRDTQAHSDAFNELAANHEQFSAEWDAQGMRPLWFSSIGPAVLGANEPVENIEWMENKSIRATGYFTQALDAVGANAVAISNAEVYEAMQRGTIDAFYASTLDGAALDNSHFEVSSHWHDLGAGEYVTIATAVSQRALDQLTEEEQAILAELSAQVSAEFFDTYYFPQMEVACDNAINGGLESLVIWPEEEAQRFADAAAEVVKQQWIADTEAGGTTGAEEFYDQFVATVGEKEATSTFGETATERCAARFG
ncbi:MAG TPA: TRAP transporter substrate-binding protein DctP [Acidimicrobiia bacterium]|nr:TRAP transporter substrate-binding protein DctP [Acidimicrobiia bacterium]